MKIIVKLVSVLGITRRGALMPRMILGLLLIVFAPRECFADTLSLTKSVSYQQAIDVTYSNPTVVGNKLQVTIQIQNTSGTWVYIEQDTTSTPNIPVSLPYTVYLLGPGGTKTLNNVAFTVNSYLKFNVTTPIGLDFTTLATDPKPRALFGAMIVDCMTRGLLTFALPANAFDEPFNSVTGVVDPLLDNIVSTLQVDGSSIGSAAVDLKNRDWVKLSADFGQIASQIASESSSLKNSISQLLQRANIGFSSGQVGTFFDHASTWLGVIAEVLDLPAKYTLLHDISTSTFGASLASWNRFDVVVTAQAPSVSYVSPSSFTGLPIGQARIVRIIGSGFTASSTLTFNDGVNPSYTGRVPTFVSANELDYYITTGTNQADWTVQVVNGAEKSNLGYFTVVAPTPNTGSITVNLSPAGAVSAGAQWRVDGGNYRNSGDTVIGLTAGSHTISFKSVSGYTTPADKTISVSNGLNNTTSISYTVDAPTTYTLNVSAVHGYVAVNPDLNEYPPGTEVRLIANPDDGYVFDSWSGNASGSDPKIYVTMNRDRNITANFKVDTSMGHIRVNISPAQAVAEGAKWKYRYYTEWQNSGGLLDYIPTGTGYVNFKDIPGWITPDQIKANIVGGQTTNVTAVYREILGGVQVTLSPYTAGGAGARWRLDGGVWTESGVTLADVSTGSHQIEFLSIPGWTAPPSQSVIVERGIIATRTGIYGPPAGMPIITAVSPKTGPIAGGTKITIEGVNFQAGATVSFGEIPSTSVTVVSSTKITAVSPPRASYGSVSLSLTTGGQTIVQQNGFSYLNALGSNIELVGQYGGNVEAVAVTGSMVCYGEGPGLVIADISNPAAPVERGRIGLPCIVKGLAIVGNTVFVAAGAAGLYAVDISIPTNPSIVGFFDTEGYALGVDVQDNIAYVGDETTGGLQILNVANPMAIVRLGVLKTPCCAARVAVGTIASKKYAFVAESQGSGAAVRVIDVTTPANPVERTNILAQGSAGITDVKLVGTTLYLSDWESGVKIYNVSVPENIVQTGFRGNVVGAFIDVVGDRLYTCDGFLRISDLTVTPEPSRLGYFDVAPLCSDLVVSNGLAFAAMGRDGLRIINVSNPASMSLRSAIQTMGGVEDVWVSGSTAFVGNSDGLFTLDISNPTRPSRLGALPGERVTDIVIAGGTATLVNDGASEVRIVNVENPAAPILLGTYGNVRGYDVALFGTTPVIACETNNGYPQPKIDLLNLSTPSTPQSAGSLILDSGRGIADGIAIMGNWAFVGRPHNALDVISLENPASPQKVGTVPIAHYMRDVAVSSDANYVYVGDSECGIQIVDVKSKTTPILAQLIDPPQTPRAGVASIRFFDNRLYAVESGFLFVYDVTDPASPQLVGFYDLPGSGFGISVIGDLIFVAGGNAGLSIFRLLDANEPTVTITGPTINPVWHTNASPISLDGVATDNKAVARVVWENSLGGSGVATGATTWSVTNLALIAGENIITITAFDQEGNKSSDSISVTYAPMLLSQTIIFPAITDRTFGDAPISLVAAASSGLPVTFSIVSGPAILSNNVLRLIGAGAVTVRAAQPGDGVFNAAPLKDVSFNVARADQSITFVPVSDKFADDKPFSLTATASSGLFVYLSILSGPAVLDTNNVLTLFGGGEINIIAWQPGNSNYNAAVPVLRSFNVSKIPQRITFGTLSQQNVGDAPFSLYATSDSGLPVLFSVSGPAVLNGNILTLTSWGTVTVTALQSGNASYAAAANVVQSLFVAPPDNTIVSPERFPDGSFHLAFYGLTGSNYWIQGSTNLTDWQIITNFTGADVLLYFNDASAVNFKQRFYRAKMQ